MTDDFGEEGWNGFQYYIQLQSVTRHGERIIRIPAYTQAIEARLRTCVRLSVIGQVQVKR